MDTIKKLYNKIARLETKLDFYETEFKNLDKVLIKCGFTQGILTLKTSAKELIKEFQKNKKK